MTDKHTLRPDQEAAVWRLLAEPTKAALIASDMGRGKTTVASEFVVRAGFERVLIVGVKDTFGQWAERLAAQSDGRIVLRRMDATKAGRQAFQDFLAGGNGAFFSGSQYLTAQDWTHVPVTDQYDRPVMVVDKKTGTDTDKQQSERKHLKVYAKMKSVDVIVHDESHTASNRQSIGIRTLRTIKSGYRLAMSGTPSGNKFENMWTTCLWLWPDLIDGSFHRWRERWCSTETVYLKGGRTAAKVTGEKIPGEFVKTLPLYVRAEAAEQAPEARVIHVELTPRQRQQYETLERDLLVWLESQQGLAPLVADLPITLRSRLRTATLGEMTFDADGEINFSDNTESTKLTALRGVLEHFGDQPVMIYTDSKKFAKVVVKRMRAAGFAAVEWSGDVTSRARSEIKERFMAGDPEVRYIVAVISSISTGHDGLQKVCNKAVWLSESDSAITNMQCQARLFRPGRVPDTAENPYMEVKIIARNTLDEGVFSKLITQRLSIQSALKVAA